MAEDGQESLTATVNLTPKRSHSVDTQDSLDSKRPRLSSEEDSVLVMALASDVSPELVGETVVMHNIDGDFVAIETVGPVMQDHSQVYDKFQLDLANTTTYLPVDTFEQIVAILQEHAKVLRSRPQPRDQHRYIFHEQLPDLERLSELLMELLTIDNPFPKSKDSQEKATLTVAINEFCTDFVTLSYAVTAHLTDASDYSNATSLPAELRQMLLWSCLASSITFSSGAFLKDVYKDHGAEQAITKDAITKAYSAHPRLSDQLDALLLALLRCENHTTSTIRSAVSVLQLVRSDYYVQSKRMIEPLATPVARMVTDVLDLLDTQFISVLARASPRALPKDFHEMAWLAVEGYLMSVTRYLDAEELATVAVQTAQAVEIKLVVTASTGKSKTNEVARLIRQIWLVRLGVAYLKTDYMSLRNLGINRLGVIIKDLRKIRSKSDAASYNDPMVICRLLQQLDAVPYLFGPESHTLLLGKGEDLILFLVHYGGGQLILLTMYGEPVRPTAKMTLSRRHSESCS